MGLGYSYLLFFKREKVWDALRDIARVSVHHQPPTKIILPDQQLSIPLENWDSKNNEMHYNDRKLVFRTVMYFPAEDEVILEYNRDWGTERPDRSPPDDEKENQIAIGNINLYVYLNDAKFSSQAHVLFDFNAVTTDMSYLFRDSPSIQKRFVELLERNNGVSGILDREMEGGLLFWFRGNVYDVDIYTYLNPDEIESFLRSNNQQV